jgi:predicted transcriptional regulator
MSEQATFTLKLEPALHADFTAAAASEDRPAAQIIREFMRNYIAQNREKNEYNEFLRRKVEAARQDIRAGLVRSNAEVQADFDALYGNRAS